MAALLSILHARTLALRRTLSVFAPAFFALALILSTPALAFAQWEQADGDKFAGSKNYWGLFFSESSLTLCGPLRIVRYFILIAGGVLFVWLLFKGGRGDYRAWGLMIVIALVLTFVTSPGWWFESFGLHNLYVLRFWARCGF